MTGQTFKNGMIALSKNYSKNVFNPSDKEMAAMWFSLLQHIDDDVFMKAVHKILINEVFAPNLATISKYCSEIAAPVVDDTEGWGLVIKAINNYGYMRSEEAMKSLPYTVRKAVEYMGGFEQICRSEEPDVIRGQFNKCMASINERERTSRREREGLLLALENERQQPVMIESKEFKRSDVTTTEAGISSVESVIASLGLRR